MSYRAPLSYFPNQQSSEAMKKKKKKKAAGESQYSM